MKGNEENGREKAHRRRRKEYIKMYGRMVIGGAVIQLLTQVSIEFMFLSMKSEEENIIKFFQYFFYSIPVIRLWKTLLPFLSLHIPLLVFFLREI